MRPQDSLFIYSNILALSRVIKLLSIRYSQDPDGDEYMNNQFKFTLSGGKTNPSNFIVSKDRIADKDSSKKVGEMAPTIAELTRKLTNISMPQETHLAILSAPEIGCHHPELASKETVPVVSLHDSSGLCNTCPSSFKIDIENGIFNPYHCWRRGHRAERFGFVYNIGLQNVSGEWIINNNKRHNKISSSQLVLASLRSDFSRKSKNTEIKFELLDKRMASAMMIVIKIKSKKVSQYDEVDEIKSILPAQMLVSSHVELNSVFSDSASKEKLPEFLSNLVESIEQKWRTNSPSKNSMGILSMSVIHNKSKDLVESIMPSLIIKNLKIKAIEWSKLEVKFIEIIDKTLKTEAGVSVCLFLDPIMDVGGDFNQY